MTSYFTSYFSRQEAPELGPYSVVSIDYDAYVYLEIVDRADGLIIHNKETENDKYEIILLQKPNHSPKENYISLYRSSNLEECESYFGQLKPILPVLMKTVPNLMTLESLGNVCEYIRVNALIDSSLNIAHVCACFGFTDFFKAFTSRAVSPQRYENILPPDLNLEDVIDCKDAYGRTPLHIAIEYRHQLTVSAILQAKPALHLTDSSGNTVLHYAAKVSREILTMLYNCSRGESEVNIWEEMLLNKTNQQSQSPLYIACANDRIDCAKVLINFGANLHGANLPEATENLANVNQEICRIDPNDANYNSWKYIVAQLDEAEMKKGGTPLHWEKSAKNLLKWLQLNVDVNLRNFDGSTALHRAIVRQNLDSVINLLRYGAQVNAFGENQKFNTPLHLAVLTKNVSIVQALLVFGADVNIHNSDGHSALHLVATRTERTPETDRILYTLHSVGAKRCTATLPLPSPCSEGCLDGPDVEFVGSAPTVSSSIRSKPMYDALLIGPFVKKALQEVQSATSSEEGTVGKYISPFVKMAFGAISASEHETASSQIRLLSLDGGGLRGLILIQILLHLERMSKRPTIELFDWIAGTSTGGILALLIASKNSLVKCQQLYFKYKDDIFSGSKPYSAEKMEVFMQECFGNETRMKDIDFQLRKDGIDFRVIVPVTSVKYFPPELKLFRSYPGPDEEEEQTEQPVLSDESPPELELKSHEELAWRVARATSAAPTFFTQFDCYLDGALTENNPILSLLGEVQKFNVTHRQAGEREYSIIAAVSLGTGLMPKGPAEKIMNPSLTSVSGYTQLSFLAKMLVEQTTETEQSAKRAQVMCSMIGAPFFRVNPPLAENIALDETDNVKLVEMLWQTMAYLHRNQETIQQLVTILTSK